MWSAIDGLNLREFLATTTGKNLIQEFEQSEPNLDGSSIEEQALNASRYQQWKSDKTFIKNLRDYQESPTTQSEFIDTSTLD